MHYTLTYSTQSTDYVQIPDLETGMFSPLTENKLALISNYERQPSHYLEQA